MSLRLSVGILGLSPLETTLAASIIRASRPRTRASTAPEYSPYALSVEKGADVLIVDCDMEKAKSALNEYTSRHASPPCLIAVGAGECPQSETLRLPRPVTGTTLNAALSACADAYAAANPSSSRDGAEFPDARVLIAESDGDRADDLKEALKGLAGAVSTTFDHAEALAMVETGGVDVVVLDRALCPPPGLELCEAARRNGKVAVVMLVSGGDYADRRASLDAGCDTYLIRPVNDIILCEVIAEYLDEC